MKYYNPVEEPNGNSLPILTDASPESDATLGGSSRSRSNVFSPSYPDSAAMLDHALPAHPTARHLPANGAIAEPGNILKSTSVRDSELETAATAAATRHLITELLEVSPEARDLLKKSAGAGLLDEDVASAWQAVEAERSTMRPILPLLKPSLAENRRLSLDPRTQRMMDRALFSSRRSKGTPLKERRQITSQLSTARSLISARIDEDAMTTDSWMSDDEPSPKSRSNLHREPLLRKNSIQVSDAAIAHAKAVVSARFHPKKSGGLPVQAPRRPPSSFSIQRSMNVLGGRPSSPQDINTTITKPVPFVTAVDRPHPGASTRPVQMGPWYLPVELWGNGRKNMVQNAAMMDAAVQNSLMAK